jgi:hypothetical protein
MGATLALAVLSVSPADSLPPESQARASPRSAVALAVGTGTEVPSVEVRDAEAPEDLAPRRAPGPPAEARAAAAPEG